MKMLSFFVANRLRKGRKQSGMLSLISILSMLSIALGIAALIIGLSAMNGFEKELKNRVLSVISHGEFYDPNSGLSDWKSIQKEINKNKNIVASAPFVRFTGLLENGNKLKAIQVEGVDPKQEKEMSALPSYVLNEKWSFFKNGQNQIIIGSGLANRLALKEGDMVTLLIPTISDSNQFKQSKRVRLSVLGIMDFSGSLGNDFALIPLQDAQKILQSNDKELDDKVTGIKVNVSDLYQASTIVYQIANTLDERVYAKSWEQNYGYMYHDILMIRQIMYLAMVIVIGVACFSIVSTLVIAVKDKQRDIAILKTLGGSNRLISRIFLFYGFISGLIGSIVGVILGIVISLNLSSILKGIEILVGRKLLNSHIYFIDFLPSEIHYDDVIIVFLTAIILTLFASYYPARRACKIDPVKILNGY